LNAATMWKWPKKITSVIWSTLLTSFRSVNPFSSFFLLLAFSPVLAL
jgi:hypothetical protein